MRRISWILAVACLALTFGSVAFASSQITLQNNSGQTLNLYVDGKYACGPAQPNAFYPCGITPGSHLLEAKYGETVVKSETIDIRDGESKTWTVEGGSKISGDWRGNFRYDDPKRAGESGFFTMNLTEQGSRISGSATEPRTTFGPNVGFLKSDISGTYNAATMELRFTKTYYYDGHKVEYSGKLDASGRRAFGQWWIGNYAGTWTADK